MTGPTTTTTRPDNPLHLHIDCTQGISARSFLDGLRALARSSGDEHSRDAFQIDPMSANIWLQHIPNNDREVLQDGSRIINQESPVQSWEPFRKAIRESPLEVSERVLCQLKELLDAIEEYYDEEVKKTSPLYPSVVWHMMAVVLLLDRMRIRTMTASVIPKGERAPKVMTEILKDFPECICFGENPVTTTFDGAVLIKVLKPASPFSPDRVFHGKAIGRDATIETELGLTYQSLQVARSEAVPPEKARDLQGFVPREIGIEPRGSDPPDSGERPVAAAPPPTPQRQVQQQARAQVVPQPQQNTKAIAAPPPAQQRQVVDKSATQGGPPPSEEKETGALESPLWNVEKDLALLQTNIDDMTSEHLAFCAELLFQQGAADVWLTPIVMKKGRPAHMLNCLTKDNLTQSLLTTIFRQTTTLGVRVWSSSGGFQRVSLRRETVTIDYCRRPVQVKVAYLGKEPVSLKPEYDQCVQVAKDTQIPLLVVAEEVKALAKDHTRRKLLAMI